MNVEVWMGWGKGDGMARSGYRISYAKPNRPRPRLGWKKRVLLHCEIVAEHLCAHETRMCMGRARHRKSTTKGKLDVPFHFPLDPPQAGDGRTTRPITTALPPRLTHFPTSVHSVRGNARMPLPYPVRARGVGRMGRVWPHALGG